MPDQDSTAISGVEVRGYRRGALSTDSWDQYVIPTKDRITTYKGRCNTFITPGRIAAPQRILALHNATGSPVLVCVNRLRVDMIQTVVKALGTFPPAIRCHRFTALPANGTGLAKVPLDTNLASNAAVTLWGDSSADAAGAGTSSTTTLAVTVPAGMNLSQVYAPRWISAVGYEPIDTALFFEGDSDITLRALEGVVISLDAYVAAGNPITDRWLATIDWEEFTRP